MSGDYHVLAGWQRALLSLALPFTVAAMVAGALGLIVLMDNEHTSWLAGTQFAYLVHKLAHINTNINAMLLNGGMIGTATILFGLAGRLPKQVKKQRSPSAASAAPSAPAPIPSAAAAATPASEDKKSQ
ncbi:hypothetical protein V8C86DRAFT_1714355 [Haematococcus lacustris]